MVMNYANFDTNLHMIHHYKKISSAKSIVNTATPKSFLEKKLKFNSTSNIQFSTSNLSKINKIPKVNSQIELRKRKNTNTTSQKGPRSSTAPRPVTRRNPNTLPHNYLKTNSNTLVNNVKDHHIPHELQIIPLKPRRRSVPINYTENKNMQSEVKPEASGKTTSVKMPIPTPRLSVITSKSSTISEFEYLQFSLRITEDIIRNDLYNPSEMQRVFNSHIEANRGRLSLGKMMQQIENLCKELNISINLSRKSKKDKSNVSKSKNGDLYPNTLPRETKETIIQNIVNKQYELTEEEIHQLNDAEIPDVLANILGYETSDIQITTLYQKDLLEMAATLHTDVNFNNNGFFNSIVEVVDKSTDSPDDMSLAIEKVSTEDKSTGISNPNSSTDIKSKLVLSSDKMQQVEIDNNSLATFQLLEYREKQIEINKIEQEQMLSIILSCLDEPEDYQKHLENSSLKITDSEHDKIKSLTVAALKLPNDSLPGEEEFLHKTSTEVVNLEDNQIQCIFTEPEQQLVQVKSNEKGVDVIKADVIVEKTKNEVTINLCEKELALAIEKNMNEIQLKINGTNCKIPLNLKPDNKLSKSVNSIITIFPESHNILKENKQVATEPLHINTTKSVTTQYDLKNDLEITNLDSEKISLDKITQTSFGIEKYQFLKKTNSESSDNNSIELKKTDPKKIITELVKNKKIRYISKDDNIVSVSKIHEIDTRSSDSNVSVMNNEEQEGYINRLNFLIDNPTDKEKPLENIKKSPIFKEFSTNLEMSNNFVTKVNHLLSDQMKHLFSPLGRKKGTKHIFDNYESCHKDMDKYIIDKYKNDYFHPKSVTSPFIKRTLVNISSKSSEFSEGEIIPTPKISNLKTPNTKDPTLITNNTNILSHLDKYEKKQSNSNVMPNAVSITSYELKVMDKGIQPRFGRSFFYPTISTQTNEAIPSGFHEILLSDGEVRCSSESDDMRTDTSDDKYFFV